MKKCEFCNFSTANGGCGLSDSSPYLRSMYCEEAVGKMTASMKREAKAFDNAMASQKRRYEKLDRECKALDSVLLDLLLRI